MLGWIAIVFLLAANAFAQPQDPIPTQAQVEEIREGLKDVELVPGLLQESAPSPGVEYVEASNHKRDIEVGLKNGFRFKLSMGAYGAEALQNYESLPAQKREKFLTYRIWLTEMLSGLLTVGSFAPGIYYSARDMVYFVGKRTEVLRELHHNRFVSPSNGSPSIFRDSRSFYQRSDWTVPQKTYYDQTYELYTQVMMTFDEQLVRTSGILNIYNKKFTQDWFDVALQVGASARGGRVGGGKTPPVWFSLGVNWEKKTIMQRIWADNEVSILGQAYTLPGIRLAWSRAGAEPSEMSRTSTEGQNYQPWGPFSFSTTPDRTTVYLAWDILSLVPIIGTGLVTGFDPFWTILSAFAPSLSWAMSSVGRVTRAQFLESGQGIRLSQWHAARLPGYHAATQILGSLVGSITERGRAAIQRLKITVATFRHDPRGSVNKYREDLDRRAEARYQARRPKSCAIIFRPEFLSEGPH